MRAGTKLLRYHRDTDMEVLDALSVGSQVQLR